MARNYILLYGSIEALETTMQCVLYRKSDKALEPPTILFPHMRRELGDENIYSVILSVANVNHRIIDAVHGCSEIFPRMLYSIADKYYKALPIEIGMVEHYYQNYPNIGPYYALQSVYNTPRQKSIDEIMRRCENAENLLFRYYDDAWPIVDTCHDLYHLLKNGKELKFAEDINRSESKLHVEIRCKLLEKNKVYRDGRMTIIPEEHVKIMKSVYESIDSML